MLNELCSECRWLHVDCNGVYEDEADGDEFNCFSYKEALDESETEEVEVRG